MTMTTLLVLSSPPPRLTIGRQQQQQDRRQWRKRRRRHDDVTSVDRLSCTTLQLMCLSLFHVVARGKAAMVVQAFSLHPPTPSQRSSSLYMIQQMRRSIELPLVVDEMTTSSSPSSTSSPTGGEDVLLAFDAVVDHYSNFLVADQEAMDSNDHESDDEGEASSKPSTKRSCSIPVFGKDARMTLQVSQDNNERDEDEEDNNQQQSLSCTVHLDGISSHQDYVFLCNKLWDVRLLVDSWNDCALDLTPFRKVVATTLNEQTVTAPTGFDAADAAWADSSLVSDLFEKHNPQALNELYTQGYTIMETPWTTSIKSHHRLSRYLTERTDQRLSTRRDKVHFLSSQRAEACGMSDQFELLMGVAHYLNTHYDETTPATGSTDDNTASSSSSCSRSFRSSPYVPLSPGTYDRPLSIPDDIQLAEYGDQDFYVVHSDNSLLRKVDTTENVTSNDNDEIITTTTRTERRNYRHLTCILYMNDDWDEHQDGGALRLYPGSRDLLEPKQVLGTATSTQEQRNNASSDPKDARVSEWDHVDVSPSNGRMILFDSCLAHSVQAVTTSTKVRRALTLWIYRPEDNGAKGEQFY